MGYDCRQLLRNGRGAGDVRKYEPGKVSQSRHSLGQIARTRLLEVEDDRHVAAAPKEGAHLLEHPLPFDRETTQYQDGLFRDGVNRISKIAVVQYQMNELCH